MKKVFLGGTCNNSLWRDRLIPLLNIEFFNPVVDDWTEDCMEEERTQRKICDFLLYTITPSMKGVYSIAEVIDDSNKKPSQTIFCLLEQEVTASMFLGTTSIPAKKFDEAEMKSLNQVGEMVVRNGGTYLKSLEDVAEFLNTH